jgi:hypothetical protein
MSGKNKKASVFEQIKAGLEDSLAFSQAQARPANGKKRNNSIPQQCWGLHKKK